MNPHLNELTYETIGAAIEVHRHLGPGLLESSYRECLCRELALRGIDFRRECGLPVEYKGVRLNSGYRVDILVADLVVVEVKAVEALAPVHEAQLLTSLRRRMESWTPDQLQRNRVKGRNTQANSLKSQ